MRPTDNNFAVKAHAMFTQVCSTAVRRSAAQADDLELLFIFTSVKDFLGYECRWVT